MVNTLGVVPKAPSCKVTIETRGIEEQLSLVIICILFLRRVIKAVAISMLLGSSSMCFVVGQGYRDPFVYLCRRENRKFKAFYDIWEK